MDYPNLLKMLLYGFLKLLSTHPIHIVLWGNLPFKKCLLKKYISIYIIYEWKILIFSVPRFNSDKSRPNNEPDGGSFHECVKITVTSIKSTALWRDIPCLANEANQFICKVEAKQGMWLIYHVICNDVS